MGFFHYKYPAEQKKVPWFTAVLKAPEAPQKSELLLRPLTNFGLWQGISSLESLCWDTGLGRGISWASQVVKHFLSLPFIWPIGSLSCWMPCITDLGMAHPKIGWANRNLFRFRKEPWLCFYFCARCACVLLRCCWWAMCENFSVAVHTT